MNTMLELSRYAHYDAIAACLIVAVVVATKFWFHPKSRHENVKDGATHR